MANAFLGVPQAYTLPTLPAGAYPATNVANDEVGLIWRSNNVASSTFLLDLEAGHSPIGAILLLGANKSTLRVQYLGATSVANRTNGIWVYNQNVLGAFSANRSAVDAKYLHVPSVPQNVRYWRIDVYNDVNGTTTGVVDLWRILLLKKIQPPDNIEVGANVGIDDRSQRRYARGGRRNIDPVGIFPTFEGSWPWIDVAQFRTDFRPLMFKRGGTYPVAFVFDHDETAWGEDEIFYGDLEKGQSISYEDGYLFSFPFAIVSLAP